LGPDGEEWTGIDPEREADADAAERHEYAYSDEEQLATVTIVEDFDPSALLHGAAAASEERHGRTSTSPPPPPPPPPPHLHPRRRGKVEGENEWGSATRSKGKKNGAAKKVRYETRAARRATRATQHARRTEKAERAGGKAMRNKAGRKKKHKVRRG
jgi:ribosomal RNA-processing protein 17